MKYMQVYWRLVNAVSTQCAWHINDNIKSQNIASKITLLPGYDYIYQSALDSSFRCFKFDNLSNTNGALIEIYKTNKTNFPNFSGFLYDEITDQLYMCFYGATPSIGSYIQAQDVYSINKTYCDEYLINDANIVKMGTQNNHFYKFAYYIQPDPLVFDTYTAQTNASNLSAIFQYLLRFPSIGCGFNENLKQINLHRNSTVKQDARQIMISSGLATNIFDQNLVQTPHGSELSVDVILTNFYNLINIEIQNKTYYGSKCMGSCSSYVKPTDSYIIKVNHSHYVDLHDLIMNSRVQNRPCYHDVDVQLLPWLEFISDTGITMDSMQRYAFVGNGSPLNMKISAMLVQNGAEYICVVPDQMGDVFVLQENQINIHMSFVQFAALHTNYKIMRLIVCPVI